MNDPFKPLLNRATQAEFAPGSTFKPFVLWPVWRRARLTTKLSSIVRVARRFTATTTAAGTITGMAIFRCIGRIRESCDVFFYNVANKLGIDRLAEYADIAGFGHKTEIDLPNERESTMPSTKWKLRLSRQKWYAGETISVALGKAPSPFRRWSWLLADGGLGNRGKWMQPHLVAGTAPKVLRDGPFQPREC